MTTSSDPAVSDPAATRPGPGARPPASGMGTGSPLGAGARIALALLRIALGFTFLWAFLDKLFGLGYSTPRSGSWINGGSPTKGFLSHVDVGPLTTFFHNIAGKTWCDWLFMIALAGLGVALMLGIGMRVSAVGGTVLLAMMWTAEWPPDKTTSSLQPSGSANPVLDFHVIYALGIIACTLCYAGRTVGLGRAWERTSLVQRFRWLT